MNISVFPRKDTLPLSQSQMGSDTGILRRRLSALSFQTFHHSATDLRRTKSFSSAGSSIRRWWDWGWGWILSRKPTFAADLEMNEEETAALGSHSRGSWRHLLFRVTTQLRRKLLNSDGVGLPQTCRYANNFDDAGRRPAVTLVH